MTDRTGSHPLRMRGLKYERSKQMINPCVVTSLADAWIKMSKPIIAKKTFLSHPSWVRGLKYEVSISWIT